MDNDDSNMELNRIVLISYSNKETVDAYWLNFISIFLFLFIFLTDLGLNSPDGAEWMDIPLKVMNHGNNN